MTIPPRNLPNRPLVYIAIALAAGALISQIDPEHGLLLLWILLSIFICVCIAAIKLRTSRWFKAVFIVASCVVGCLRGMQAQTVAADDVSRNAGNTVQLSGTVFGNADKIGASTSFRFVVEVSAIGSPGSSDMHPISGRVQAAVFAAYDSKSDEVREEKQPAIVPQIGDSVELTGRLELPQPANNPGGYDNRAALGRKGIFSQITVMGSDGFKIISTHETSGSLFLAIQSTNFKNAIESHNRNHLSTENAGVINAIMLGDKSGLTLADRKLFNDSGTVHLLSAAGLQTGLILILLISAYRWVGLQRKIGLALTFAAVVAYTGMAGDRPSVERVAIMAVIYLIGQLLDR